MCCIVLDESQDSCGCAALPWTMARIAVGEEATPDRKPEKCKIITRTFFVIRLKANHVKLYSYPPQAINRRYLSDDSII